MSKIQTYVFVEPEYIEAEDAKNIHIFEANYDNEENKVYVKNPNCYSCCGRCSVKKYWKCLKMASGNSLEEKRKDARRIAKEFEDIGRTVCGQCVSTFYNNDI